MSSRKAARDDRARLARTLRELRRAAGLGGIAAGRLAGVSQSKISKIENGVLRASPDDVGKLCGAYGVPLDEQNALIRLAESLQTETIDSRRVTLSRGAHLMQQRIHRIEASASLLRSFQPCMIIGLLQTEAYARRVFSASTTGSALDRAVEARMARQAELREGETRAVLIMTEGALRWHAGNSEVMLQQIEAITIATRSPNVRVGIIPYSTPVDVFPRHGFHLYDADAVIIGTETGTATITDNDDIADYARLFDRLESLAEFDEPARGVLARIANDYKAL